MALIEQSCGADSAERGGSDPLLMRDTAEMP